MKRTWWSSLGCLFTLCCGLAARAASGDVAGTLHFNNYVFPDVEAKVSRPDGTGAGAGAKAQLLVVGPDGGLVPIQPGTTFRTSSAEAAYFVSSLTLSVTGYAPGVEVKLRMRAWEGDTYETAKLRGESKDFSVKLGGGLQPPANLVGLVGFTLGGASEPPATVAVTGLAGLNGALSPKGTFKANKGSSVEFNATPDAGYVVDRWFVNRILKQTGGNAFKLVNVSEESTVLVVFKKASTPTLTITSASGPNGIVDPSGKITVNKGQSQSFKVRPDAGYVVEKWTVDNAAVQSGGDTFTLSNIQQNHSVLVTFKPQITSKDGVIHFNTRVGGLVDAKVSRPDGTGAGDGVKAQIVQLGGNGESKPLLPLTTFRTESPEAAFYVKPVDVTVPGVPPGSEIKVLVRAWEGDSYEKSLLRGQSEPIVVKLGGGQVPPANLTGLQGFSLKKLEAGVDFFVINPAPGANGTMSPDAAIKKAKGESQAFTAKPNRGYTVDNWFVDGNPVQAGGETFTLANIQANHDVSVSFRSTAATEGGVVLFNTYVPTQVEAKVSRPDGTGAGAGAKAQLVLVGVEGKLTALRPMTTFRDESAAAAFFVNPVNVPVPGTAPGQKVTLRMRAWTGDSWDRSKLRGESKDFSVVLGGGILPPANLVGLEGFTLGLPSADALPFITEQPKSVKAFPGSTVVFNVKAAGTPPLTYQWFHNGEAIQNASADALKIEHVKASDIGKYHVVVKNSAGATTSRSAELELRRKRVLGDFDGDGSPDIILVHLDRTLAFWLMDGVRIRTGLTPFKLEDGWSIVGTGDFNKDGKTDVLLKHRGRSLAIWFMDGTEIKEGVIPMSLPEGWDVAAVGDFNNDDQTDLLVQGKDGSLAFWLMDGAKVDKVVNAPFKLPEGWRITGAGDFDNDGETDILLRHSNRSLAFWLMKGTEIKDGLVPFSVPEGWNIIGLGDFNHDGKTDIMLRHSEHWIAFWYMNGVNIAQGVVPMKQPEGWKIISKED